MSEPSVERGLAVIVLAAGKGKRMGNPDLAKVLVPLQDRPLLGHVLDTVNHLHADRVCVIVGHQAEAVSSYVSEHSVDATTALQAEQLGTGHAVQQTKQALYDFQGDVIILSGDVPLMTIDTLNDLLTAHRDSHAVLTVLTAVVPDPTGYGRIVRRDGRFLERIVEHKDASDTEREIDEINSGIYVVDRSALFDALDRVSNANAQGEFYLTDIAGILNADGHLVNIHCADDWQELQGINTPDDLAQADAILSARLHAHHRHRVGGE
jgi:UDP-N-acetylglucosamine diphosphorylase/glucosamine-1-phosphate N-acetyltransferase